MKRKAFLTFLEQNQITDEDLFHVQEYLRLKREISAHQKAYEKYLLVRQVKRLVNEEIA